MVLLTSENWLPVLTCDWLSFKWMNILTMIGILETQKHSFTCPIIQPMFESLPGFGAVPDLSQGSSETQGGWVALMLTPSAES